MYLEKDHPNIEMWELDMNSIKSQAIGDCLRLDDDEEIILEIEEQGM